LRTKEQDTRLILHEHDDDDDVLFTVSKESHHGFDVATLWEK
jgi:hypothetical protein